VGLIDRDPLGDSPISERLCLIYTEEAGTIAGTSASASKAARHAS
jgi:hypothetical protein